MLELTVRGIEIVETLIHAYPFKSEVPVKPKKGTGFGIKEAPRGTLYHRYSFDETGRCVSANIITPTAQLQAVIEKDLRNFLGKFLNTSEQEIKKRAEMLIRAYDP
jgi:sulfhydrogenase subunit alpha